MRGGRKEKERRERVNERVEQEGEIGRGLEVGED